MVYFPLQRFTQSVMVNVICDSKLYTSSWPAKLMRCRLAGDKMNLRLSGWTETLLLTLVSAMKATVWLRFLTYSILPFAKRNQTLLLFFLIVRVIYWWASAGRLVEICHLDIFLKRRREPSPVKYSIVTSGATIWYATAKLTKVASISKEMWDGAEERGMIKRKL